MRFDETHVIFDEIQSPRTREIIEQLLDENEKLRRDKKALLRMLLARATWRDRWQGWKYPNHWIHKAIRDLEIP